MREYIESKGPKTLASPVTSSELFNQINEGCSCICCKMNQAAGERLLLIELNELAQEEPNNPAS